MAKIQIKKYIRKKEENNNIYESSKTDRQQEYSCEDVGNGIIISVYSICDVKADPIISIVSINTMA